MAKEKNVSHSIIKICLLGLLVVGMCWWTMKDNYQEVLTQLGKLHFFDLIFLVFISSLMYVISGIILTILAKKSVPDYRYRDGISVSFITMFTSNVMFSATSKLVQYFLFYAKKIKMDAATCIIALEFLSYQILMMVLSLGMMIVYHDYFSQMLPNEVPIAWFGTLISFLPLIAVSLLLWYPPIQGWIRKLLSFFVTRLHFHINVAEFDEKLYSFMQCLIQLKDAFLQDTHLLLQLLFWNIIRHIVKHGVPFAIAIVLQIPLTPWKIWMLFLCSMFLDLWLTAIPIAGKHGFAEAGFVSIFAILIGDVQASAMMLLWRFVTFYANTLMGGLCLMLNPDISLEKIKQLKKDKKTNEA